MRGLLVFAVLCTRLVAANIDELKSMPLPERAPAFNKGEVWAGGTRLAHSGPQKQPSAWRYDVPGTQEEGKLICPDDHDKVPCLFWTSVPIDTFTPSTCVVGLYFKTFPADTTIVYTPPGAHAVYVNTGDGSGKEPCGPLAFLQTGGHKEDEL
eukprot:TRINITY_DN38859_c0_g1_i1.p1 TRINITY_DN38859_c0_g1~~TRINITY_DN38859_c0_g1_i1.p1  ORF type:complete len:153 (+),score=22.58 TRINITY_DN38859_c0_g1_i1:77-535(+)